MISQESFHSVKNRSAQLLVLRGYEPVQPVTGSYLSRYIPLHLIGLKGDYEALCVKLRIARGSVSEPYVETLCRYDLCQFRSLLLAAPGNLVLRCEIWVVSPNGSIHCYEVFPTSIHEVAAFAR